MLIRSINASRVIASLTDIELLIEEACRDLEVEDVEAFHVTLAVSEMASNIIRHSEFDSKLEDCLVVEVYSALSTIKVLLIDHCNELCDALVEQMVNREGSVAPHHARLEDVPESGWGLGLIHSAANSVVYRREDGCNLYELVFALDTV